MHKRAAKCATFWWSLHLLPSNGGMVGGTESQSFLPMRKDRKTFKKYFELLLHIMVMELNSQLVWYTYYGQCILYHTTRPTLFGTKMIMFHEMTQWIASKSAILLAYGNNEGSYNILKIQHSLKPFTGPFGQAKTLYLFPRSALSYLILSYLGGFRNVPNFENSYLQLPNLL